MYKIPAVISANMKKHLLPLFHDLQIPTFNLTTCTNPFHCEVLETSLHERIIETCSTNIKVVSHPRALRDFHDFKDELLSEGPHVTALKICLFITEILEFYSRDNSSSPLKLWSDDNFLATSPAVCLRGKSQMTENFIDFFLVNSTLDSLLRSFFFSHF